MEIRTFVSFDAHGFPDESRWTENGSPLIPDGHSIAEHIVVNVRGIGLDVSDPRQHEFYGWEFKIQYGDEVNWCLLQCPGPWLLLVRPVRSSILQRLRFVQTDFQHLERTLMAIDRVLKRDTRFDSVQWFTEQAYEAGVKKGEDRPL